MLYYLCHFDNYYGPLRLFRYITVRSTLAFVLSLLWLYLIGPKIFAWLSSKKCLDIVRSEDKLHKLAELHKSKNKVPTMGGLAIIFAVIFSCVLCFRFNVYCVSALLIGIIMAITGMIDDWRKIKQKSTNGIKSYWKWFAQGVGTFVLLCIILTEIDYEKIACVYSPFFKNPILYAIPPALLFLYWFIVLSGTSNAINLTDGIDGLAVGCTLSVVITYAIFSYVTGNVVLSNYLNLPYLNGVEELCVLCSSICGACIGFLWFNAHPAEIFMGDTGSLALGAWVGCIALMVHQSISLIVVGFVFVLEAGSVILQVTSFKLFKKRIFKMSPLHHHFELLNIPESKIIVRFWIISLLCSLAGLLLLKLR